MKPQQMVATLQRVASEAIKVQPRAARYQNALSASATVIETLQVVSPAAVLVDLIEYPKPSGWQLSFENSLAILRDIPIEVAGRTAVQRARERGLTDLTRAGNEYHLLREIPADLRQKVTRDPRHTGRRYASNFSTRKNYSLAISPSVEVSRRPICRMPATGSTMAAVRRHARRATLAARYLNSSRTAPIEPCRRGLMKNIKQ